MSADPEAKKPIHWDLYYPAPGMTHWNKKISEWTGVTDIETLERIEDIMRINIVAFHSCQEHEVCKVLDMVVAAKM